MKIVLGHVEQYDFIILVDNADDQVMHPQQVANILSRILFKLDIAGSN